MSQTKGSPVTFGKDDVEIIARETRYKGFFQSLLIDSAIVYSAAK